MQCKLLGLQDFLNFIENPGSFIDSEWRKSAFFDGKFGVRNDFIAVHFADLTQAFASGAGAIRRVEGKQIGFWLGIRDTAGGAHQRPAVMADLSVLEIEHHQGAFAEFHAGLDGFQTTFFIDVAGNEAVYNYFDVVGFVTVKFDAFA